MLKTLPILAAVTVFGLVTVTAHTADSRTVPRTTAQRVGVSLPSEVAEIAAEQSGTIVAMPATDGQSVKQGDVLFKLSRRLQELRVQRLEALSKSSLAVKKAQAALDHAMKERQRLRELSKKDIASEKDLQDNDLAVVNAQLEYEQASLNQNVTNNDLAQAQVLLEQRTVKAPFAGIVTQILKRQGETSEKLVPVVEVAKLDPLWVEFECPVADESLYRIGAKVEVSPAARAGKRRTGKVVFVAMKANPSSHTFRVRVAVPNRNHTWKAGLKMLIQLPADSAPPKAPK